MNADSPNLGPATRRRRHLQFSLSTLLIFTLICAAACDWVASKAQRKRKEREFAAAIEGTGGRVEYDFGPRGRDRYRQGDQRGPSEPEWPGPAWIRKLFGDNFFCEIVEVMAPKGASDAELQPIEALPKIQRLYLGQTSVTDAGLAHLERLTTLKSLDLAYTKVSDSGLESLERLTGLEKLDLSYTRITNAGLVHLRGLTGLTELHLAETKVSDSGLVQLSGLTKLVELQLSGTNVGDDGLRQLGGLKRLEKLYLEATAVSNAGLRCLKALPRLKALGLSETRVDNAGLPQLADDAPRLEWLDLVYDKVSDAGLVHLRRPTHLTQLYLEYSDVTAAGVQEFERARPTCTVQPIPFIVMTRATNWRPKGK